MTQNQFDQHFHIVFFNIITKSEGQKIFHLRALRLFEIYKFSFL